MWAMGPLGAGTWRCGGTVTPRGRWAAPRVDGVRLLCVLWLCCVGVSQGQVLNTTVLLPGTEIYFPYGIQYVSLQGMGGEAFSEARDVLIIAETFSRRVVAYVLDNRTVVNVAGKRFASGTVDGVGAEARFSLIFGLVLVGALCDLGPPFVLPYVFVTDYYNNCVRRVSLWTMEVRTVAGVCNASSTMVASDGVGSTAHFAEPYFLWPNYTEAGVTLIVSDLGLSSWWVHSDGGVVGAAV